MNFISTNTDRKGNDLDLKIYQIRQQAKLCVFLVTLVHFIVRLFVVLFDPLSPKSRAIVTICLPFLAMMMIILALEYLLYKKTGPMIVRYSKIVDLALLICFMGDWMAALFSSIYRTQQADPPCFQITALYAFISFAYRTLLVTLLVQQWQLKIIGPVVATIIACVYTIHYSPRSVALLVARAVAHVFSLVLIIYCEDKVKWKLMRTNIEQEKWMQVNNFILDSIPENILILDLADEKKVEFISEYCKTFLDVLSLETRDFFKKVRDLKQQEEPVESPCLAPSNILQIERMTTRQWLVTDSNENESRSLAKIETLEDLVVNFKSIIQERNLQEKQFLIYNGKLRMTDIQQDKAIEVKISFIQHLENDYIILIFRDMTQRDLLMTLEENNRYKDQLLASVSHELRAPLNGNINLVESAVCSQKIPQDINEKLLIPALRSSKFLLHLINDILDMTQIKEKKLRLVFENQSLEETLKNTVQLVEVQAKKKMIKLLTELDPSLPKSFRTDHLRLSQIVLNLLTNATKFTKEGGVIKLIAESMTDDGSWVKISIEDSGIGISSENMNKLFSSCTYIDFEGKEEMSPAGVGLGLNIASNLVQLLAPKDHPKISVVSSINQGSTFTFILENKDSETKPRKIQDLEASDDVADELIGTRQQMGLSKPKNLLESPSSFALEARKSKSQLQETCSCSKVLIVDDNPFNIMALETILGTLDISCDSVYNGQACLQKLIDRQKKTCGGKDCKQYSVIFMDQEMPGMSGSEAVTEIKRLQSEGVVEEMKIIGCTAHKAKEEVDRFLASGLDQCIFKPVSVGMIKNTLKEIL